MYLAYKYVKRKQKEHKDQKSSAQDDDRQVTNSPVSGLGDEARRTSNGADVDVNATTAGGERTFRGRNDEAARREKGVPSPGDKLAKKRKNAYRWKLVIGLFAPFALQALDTTIIASALPYIALDFRTYNDNSFPQWIWNARWMSS